mmetsp:Transcript_13565/g.38838  ORF Transcript_13565/g.38838 Transcript_13565/m.38838 type:complete len:223 (+) Transcript_13565:1157-1825(+)
MAASRNPPLVPQVRTKEPGRAFLRDSESGWGSFAMMVTEFSGLPWARRISCGERPVTRWTMAGGRAVTVAPGVNLAAFDASSHFLRERWKDGAWSKAVVSNSTPSSSSSSSPLLLLKLRWLYWRRMVCCSPDEVLGKVLVPRIRGYPATGLRTWSISDPPDDTKLAWVMAWTATALSLALFLFFFSAFFSTIDARTMSDSVPCFFSSSLALLDLEFSTNWRW